MKLIENFFSFLKGDRGGFKAQLRCKLMGNLEDSEDRV
jgi:hypothetical protein